MVSARLSAHRSIYVLEGIIKIHFQDIGLRILDNEFIKPSRHAAQGVLNEGLLALKDRGARDAPINALGCGPVRLQAFALAVRCLREYNGFSVISRYKVEALANGGSAQVARSDSAKFQLVAKSFDKALLLSTTALDFQKLAGFCKCGAIGSYAIGEHTNESLERFARALRIGAALAVCIRNKRSPGLYLLNVLHKDTSRRYARHSPFDNNPGKPSDLMLYGLIAFCPGEVLAIGRKPGYADRSAARYFFWVNNEYILLEVLRIRVIYGVHSNRIRIVIYSYVNRPARCKLYANGSTAATCEIVYDKLVK